jgi:hypothetical protein
VPVACLHGNAVTALVNGANFFDRLATEVASLRR